MTAKQKIHWVEFSPSLSDSITAKKKFKEAIVALRKFNKGDRDARRHLELECERKRILSLYKARETGYQRSVSAINLLIDIIKQGWQIRERKGKVELGRPDHLADDCDSRSMIRMQLYAQRNEQLREKSVQTFVRSMEAKRYFKKGFVSIFSLMTDGRDLSKKLASIISICDEDKRLEKLRTCIQPYLQFVNVDVCCELTGIRLGDIWRYFRHTWSNPYKSIPGRSMMILVRDAATSFHSVIGIAALSSATVGHTIRDDHIGWTSEKILKELGQKRSMKLIHWFYNVIDGAINELYLCDLYADDNSITRKDLKKPTQEIITKLISSSEGNRKKYYKGMESEVNSKTEEPALMPDVYWEKQAKTLLFRSKREIELANLLKARLILQKHFKKQPTSAELDNFLGTKDCREVVSKVVKKAKSERVGTLLADMTICGALPPYNEILGAKLIAMLVTSPEVINEYNRRYRKQPSIIASSMAGKPIIRPAKLAFINTTSLYGQRPNQYDRISMPSKELIGEGQDTVRFKYLGKTKGKGTFHFSNQTVNDMSLLVSKTKNGQKVHSIFGEGANPRMRKIRNGLNELGVTTEEFMDHGVPRLVYGVSLVSNLRDYLLGIDKKPKYYFSCRKAKDISNGIYRWWLKRWVNKRITRDDICERIEKHTLVHPIKHGARIEMPRMNIDQELLFNE